MKSREFWSAWGRAQYRLNLMQTRLLSHPRWTVRSQERFMPHECLAAIR